MTARHDGFLERHPELRDEDLFSAPALARTAALTAPLAAYFRFRLSGWEHVPAEPCIFVANHSLASPFVLPLLARGWHQGSAGRTVRGMMHRIAYQFPFRQLGTLQALGGIYAHPDIARAALRRGHSLLVFPGGDVDAMRPFSQRCRPDFDGRRGFVRLARAEHLRLVPLAISGSHAAYVGLPGSHLLARLTLLQRYTGLKRFPFTLGTVGVAASVAATIALPLLWPIIPAALLAAALPLPSRIEARFLPPLSVEAGESDEAAAERVRRAIEEALTKLGSERATPWG
ncbi:MAG: hypothetical protein H6Q89_919 [Myxococcaceae bacterium]|nr:hypothetical protein [Myxococcaceae bacterium]